MSDRLCCVSPVVCFTLVPILGIVLNVPDCVQRRHIVRPWRGSLSRSQQITSGASAPRGGGVGSRSPASPRRLHVCSVVPCPSAVGARGQRAQCGPGCDFSCYSPLTRRRGRRADRVFFPMMAHLDLREVP